MPRAISSEISGYDLSARIKRSTTVAASPTDATETTICTLSVNEDETAVVGVRVDGWAAFTVGTNGTAARLRVRRTSIAGTVIADTGALTGGVAAAALLAVPCYGFDTAPVLPVGTYVMTLTVTAASAASTVSACFLGLIVV